MELEQTLTQIIREMLGLTAGKTEALVSSGLMDSVVIVELSTHLESQFSIDVDITDMQLANFDSIEKLVLFVKRKQELVVG